MQVTLPIPEGLKLPASGQFEVPVVLASENGELYVVSVAGVPVEATAETESEMPEEQEAPEQHMAPEKEAAQGDFLSAVQNSLKNKK